ncbi:MAG: hypothetical protein GQ582_13795 [Methyloprofundus sp.]|nr:hypothetical protein [Methyloprofundus sp.]
MNVEIESGSYINVVAIVNKKENTGEILYVNPASLATRIESTSEDPDISITVEDGAQNLLFQQQALVRYSACNESGSYEEGLIQLDIPYMDGMEVIKLVFDGKVLASYQRQSPDISSSHVGRLGFSPALVSVTKRSLTGLENIIEQKGVTYTIQVKTAEFKHWHVIAVGLNLPKVKIDRNQFPNETTVDIKVIKTTGFDDEVIAESHLSFE